MIQFQKRFKIWRAKIILLVLGLTSLSACYPGFIVPHRTEIFIKTPLENYLTVGHLGIFPFESSDSSNQLGLSVAQIFTAEISKKNLFKETTLLEDSTWLQQRDYDALKIDRALFEGKEKGFDLILLGSVDEYMPGKVGDTQVTLNVRVLEISTGNTLWWGKDEVTGKQGNTFLFFGHLLSPDPPSTKRLLHKAAKKIVSAIFKEQE